MCNKKKKKMGATVSRKMHETSSTRMDKMERSGYKGSHQQDQSFKKKSKKLYAL
mgnify:CR=1 FL=1